jgi:hypothetical protein
MGSEIKMCMQTKTALDFSHFHFFITLNCRCHDRTERNFRLCHNAVTAIHSTHSALPLSMAISLLIALVTPRARSPRGRLLNPNVTNQSFSYSNL